MELGSLFDGIGGWPLSATKYGINPVWAAEIESFPIEVTKKHFPSMKHLGDVTAINGDEIEPADIVCMGSPCQDLSIAGKCEGLSGARSGLFMDAIRIIREMRGATNGKYPKFVIWENVPGAFSSNKGNDFRAVLEEITQSSIPVPQSERWAKSGMVRSKGCEVAWRTLDAQYWGVPQRRKRIFLVADFGGQRTTEILFKPESVPRNPAGSGSKRESIAGNVESGIRAAGFKLGQGAKAHGIGWQEEIAPTLSDMDSGNKPAVIIPYQTKISSQYVSEDKCIVEAHYEVRRITPTECERLQGLPDGYTAGGSDSARYKALGNGMAQPCADFVMQGIAEVLNKKKM